MGGAGRRGIGAGKEGKREWGREQREGAREKSDGRARIEGGGSPGTEGGQPEGRMTGRGIDGLRPLMNGGAKAPPQPPWRAHNSTRLSSLDRRLDPAAS